jgi:hypothetical protein
MPLMQRSNGDLSDIYECTILHLIERVEKLEKDQERDMAIIDDLKTAVAAQSTAITALQTAVAAIPPGIDVVALQAAITAIEADTAAINALVAVIPHA